MTSGGKRNPANADIGGDQARLLVDLIEQACLRHTIGGRISASFTTIFVGMVDPWGQRRSDGPRRAAVR